MALAAYLNPGGDLAATIDCVKLCESLGYDSVWVTHGLGRDSFLVLAAYASATSRIGLGNGVVPIYPRHPVSMAQAALTLSELSGGRFRLGIGVSHKHLPRYLAEYAYRFNRRWREGDLFEFVALRAMRGEPLPYHRLTAEAVG